MFHMDVAKVDRDVVHVASVSEVWGMLQAFIENVSSVFNLTLQQLFLCRKLQMFYLDIASVCSKCFFCFRRILHLTVSCCKCLMLFGESLGAVSDERTDRGGVCVRGDERGLATQVTNRGRAARNPRCFLRERQASDASVLERTSGCYQVRKRYICFFSWFRIRYR
jgi:hypothetical protein